MHKSHVCPIYVPCPGGKIMNCFMTWLTDESVLVLFVAWKQVKLNKILTQANIIEFSVTIKTKTIGWKRSCMVIT